MTYEVIGSGRHGRGSKEYREKLLESVAEFDESLLEKF
jgi:hypothetical protein